MIEPQFEIIDAGNGKEIKAWKKGVQFEELAIEQLKQSAALPFVHPYVAAMPDCHWGIGATVGSVVPTKGAIIPAAVGVDIGCGMMAVLVDKKKSDIMVDLPAIRKEIENLIPHGRTNQGGEGDRGAWHNVPYLALMTWKKQFEPEYDELCDKHPKMKSKNADRHLGTLGTGNHFIEIVYDEQERIWIVIHSGSRGMGNRIGTYFIGLAQRKCEEKKVELPHKDLAYLEEGEEEYQDYIRALKLAQKFAWQNRLTMMATITTTFLWNAQEVVHCHHNYMAEEEHFGEKLFITRKGAVRARTEDVGIIPGSMGNKSYIVRGLGSPHSFQSCSHGAGRAMGRNEAKRRFTVADHEKATEGVECHKGVEVIDETPGAYKDIDAVMEAQKDLVEISHTLKQVICVKGLGDNDRRK